MKRSYFLFLFVVINSSILFSNISQNSQILVQKGVSHLLNFEFDLANKYLDEAIKVFPENPQPYISKSALPLWRFLFSKSEKDYQEAAREIDKSIELAETFSEKNKNNSYASLYLGIAYGNRVFLKIRNENFIGAIFDLKKSYSALKQAIKLNPECYDAYLGLGLYHYSIGSLPKTLKWIISLLGFEGNIENGLREIELAAEKGNYQKVEAAFYLTQFYPWLYGDFDKAKKILNELITKYPNNHIFLYTRGVYHLNTNQVEDALKDFLVINSYRNFPIPKLSSFSRYRLGECYFRLGNYNKAIESYKEFINDYNEDIYLPQALLNLGISLEFTNRRSEAVEFFKKATNSRSKYGDDVFAIEKAKKFMNEKITEIDSLMVVARNLHKSGQYLDAIQFYNVKLVSKKLDNSKKAEIYYYLGECYYDASEFNDAKSSFEKVLSIKENKSAWIEPWTKFYLGQIYLKMGNKESARKYFSEVLNYKNYQNERWLKYRAERSSKLIQ